MMTIKQQLKEDSGNQGKQNVDDDGTINDDNNKNGLVGDEDFDGFDKNQYVISEADKAYMDEFNKSTDSGNDVAQFLIGKDWDQNLDQDDEEYTSPLMGLITSSS